MGLFTSMSSIPHALNAPAALGAGPWAVPGAEQTQTLSPVSREPAETRQNRNTEPALSERLMADHNTAMLSK